MPASIKVTGIGRAENGRGIYVRFDDGDEIEGTRRELREAARNILSDEAIIPLLKMLAIASGLRASQDGDSVDDLDALVGKTFTFNRKAPANIVRIT
jgi:hypothetical protein